MFWIRGIIISILLAAVASAQMGGFGGFGGMAGVMNGQMGSFGNGDAVGIRPWVTATGSYFSGNAKSLSAPGSPNTKSHNWSAGLGAGIGGGKAWGRTNLGVNYGISGRLDTVNLNIPSWSHVISVGVSHMVSDRTSVFTSVLGGQTNGGYGYGAAPIGGGWGLPYSYGSALNSQISGSDFGNPNENGLVDNEVIASRTQFVAANAGINHRLSQRWSIGGSAGITYANRGAGLIDNRGISGSVMGRYMISPRSSLGIGYGYGRFGYVGLFGGSNAHQVMLSYNRLLAPGLTLGAGIGAFRFDSKFVGQVPVDPLLAAILGLPEANYEIQASTRYSMSGFLGIAKSLGRQGTVSFNYSRGISPGNGVFLGSTRDTASAAYSFPTVNRLSSAAFGSYTRLSAIQALRKSSDNYAGGLSVSTRLFQGLSLFLSGGYRMTEISGSFNTRGAFATVGISYHPGSIPIIF